MKYLSLVAAVALAVSTTAVSAKELRLSAAPPPASPWGKVTLSFVDKVAEVSGGKLTIKPFLASKLGGEQDVVKQVARGRIDIVVASNTGVSLLVPEFGLLASPYAFDTVEQADCVADEHLLDTFGDDFDNAGIRALSWMEVGFQVIFAKESALRTPADLKGKKIRTAPSITDTQFIKMAGGNAVPLSPKDTVPATKTGQVEAASQPSVFGVATGFNKVAPVITLTRHQHQVGSILISKKTWKGLSEEEQGWLNEAAPTFLALRKVLRGAEGVLLKKAASEGATVVELNDEELAAWRAIAPDAQKVILEEMGETASEKWEAIQKAKEACSA